MTELEFTFAGRRYTARPGETVGMALWRHGERTLRHSSGDGEARGMFCAMGVCFECLVRADGRLVRACLLPVRDGLAVEPGGRL